MQSYIIRRSSSRFFRKLWNYFAMQSGTSPTNDGYSPPTKVAKLGGLEESSTPSTSGTPGESSNAQFNGVDSTADSLHTGKPRLKYHKYAMLLAYNGGKYFGMQIQAIPGKAEIPTIEKELLDAMVKVNLIEADDAIKPGNSFSFQRCARTDKGVSAASQVCSMKLGFRPDTTIADTIKDINNILPPCIRVFAIQRVTKGFDAKRQCSARTYSYTLPSYAFVSCAETAKSSYRLSEEKRTEITKVLSEFCGTHNFFNFTSNRERGERSCNRYIMSFECGQPSIVQDVEMVSLLVKGQSFMLHQIRKMVGLALAIIRGIVSQSVITKAFESERMDLPKAPGLGLLLEQVHYDFYNERYAKTHDPITWSSVAGELKEFRENQIVKPIAEVECRLHPMMEWLATLHMHTFGMRREHQQIVPQLAILMRRRMLRFGVLPTTLTELELEGKNRRNEFLSLATADKVEPVK